MAAIANRTGVVVATRSGLTSSEAERRLVQFGRNEIQRDARRLS